MTALFLAVLWQVGVTRPSPPYDFPDFGRVIQPLPSVAEAEALEGRARTLERQARVLDQRADSLTGPLERAAFDDAGRLRVAADSVAAAAIQQRAGSYRKRALALDSTAAARVGSLAAREAKHQVWVYLASLDLLVAGIAGLLAFGSGLKGRRRAVGAAAAMLVPSILAGILFACGWYDYQGPPYLLASTALGEGVLSVARGSDGLHITAIVLFAVSAGFSGARLPRPGDTFDDAGAERAAREIRRARRGTRFGLFVGATMLVVYVAATSALFEWTLAYVNPEPKPLFEGIRAMTNSVVTARSLLASAMLLSLYAPAAFMLQLMADDLAARVRPGPSAASREQWLEEHGLGGTHWLHPLKPLAAILAPAATGVVAQLLQNLS